MFKKAKLFNERANILGILKTVTPAEVKQLGRKVFLFTKSVWKIHRYEILYQAVLDKFYHSKELTKLLLKNSNRFIIEAADYDKFFGIGLFEYPFDLTGLQIPKRTSTSFFETGQIIIY